MVLNQHIELTNGVQFVYGKYIGVSLCFYQTGQFDDESFQQNPQHFALNIVPVLKFFFKNLHQQAEAPDIFFIQKNRLTLSPSVEQQPGAGHLRIVRNDAIKLPIKLPNHRILRPFQAEGMTDVERKKSIGRYLKTQLVNGQ